ncbi:MAG: hypothetical protein ACRDJC_09655 [Thermomicrobiales bacterium]
MSRRAPGRATRQILSGSELAPPRDTFGSQSPAGQQISLAVAYLAGLGALVILSALVWAIWGMGPASAILLLVAIGLIASWLVV